MKSIKLKVENVTISNTTCQQQKYLSGLSEAFTLHYWGLKTEQHLLNFSVHYKCNTTMKFNNDFLFRAIGLQGYSVVNNPEQYLLSNVGTSSPLCSRYVKSEQSQLIGNGGSFQVAVFQKINTLINQETINLQC